MQKAKLFMHGRSQAVRLPKEFRFKGDSVGIRKVGSVVILYPKDNPWQAMFDMLGKFPEDFMADR